MKQFLLPAMVWVSCLGSAAAACTYNTEPRVTDDQTQHRFFNACGFYEVGYWFEGNTLHFPRGGQHTINDVSVSEAQDLLKEAYGLVKVEGKTLVRTKGLFGAPS